MQGCNQNYEGIAFQVRMTEELLRNTDINMADVSKRAGFGFTNNIYLTYKREFGIAPSERLQKIRKEVDV